MKSLIKILLAIAFICSCKKEDTKKDNSEVIANNWEIIYQNDSLCFSSISFLDKDTGYILAFNENTYQQSVLKTYNAGATWENTISTQDIHSSIQGIQATGNRGLIETNLNNTNSYRYTSDEGHTWQTILFGNFFADQIYYLDAKNFIAYSMSRLYVSSNGGLDWECTYNNQDNFNYFYLPNNEFYYKNGVFVIFVLAKYNPVDSTIIFKSADKGHTWEKYKTRLANKSICYLSDSIGFYLDGNDLYKTTDGYITFKPVSVFSYFTWSSFQCFYTLSENEWYYYSTNYCTIHHTTNGGKSWVIDFNVIDGPVYETVSGWFFLNSGEAFAITNRGKILKKRY